MAGHTPWRQVREAHPTDPQGYAWTVTVGLGAGAEATEFAPVVVRAWSLEEALRKAAELPFEQWLAGQDEDEDALRLVRSARHPRGPGPVTAGGEGG